mmetsp:Transcript_96928/g.278944  ORF Transcript_96928/g.278944 Transcript_96928/m.278944 type:complete len:211 (+) Transcript_96928:129-761(+)
MSANPQKFKVVFLGDEAAGKTSVVRRYMYDTFEDSIQATIGMDFQSKTVYLEDRTLRLQLWDTAGQERFRSLIPSYIRDAAAAVVVYDVTRRGSFASTGKWVEQVREERGDAALIALVGNKIDLTSQRDVTEAEGKQQAEEHGVLFAEASAKTGQNIKELFQMIAANLPTGQGGAPADAQAAGAGAGGTQGIQLRAEPAAAAKSSKKCQC